MNLPLLSVLPLVGMTYSLSTYTSSLFDFEYQRVNLIASLGEAFNKRYLICLGVTLDRCTRYSSPVMYS
jgi:hypothetical protein